MQNLHLALILFASLTLTMLGCTPATKSKPTATLLPTQTKPSDLAPSLTPTPAVILAPLKGSFRNQISLIEENMPRSDSEAYVIPNAEEQTAFSKLVSLIHKKDFSGAIQLATANYYRLNIYVDRGDELAASYLLREQRPIQKGWGLYAFRVDSTSNIIVEAPHPLYDRRTPKVAMDIYRALDAHALLIAGAHRNANSDGSADVAHAPESIFHSVHEALVQEIQSKSGNPIILQIHGFHTSKHEGYPQAVLGFGNSIQPTETALAHTLETALAAQGINAGICIDDTWRELCGRKNGQGALADGATFIHMELDETIRKKDDALIAALLQVFGQ